MHILRKKKWLLLLVFIFPAFLLYTYFVIYSIVNTGYYSVTKWNAISDPIFVGMKYYQDFLHDADFLMVLRNSLLNVVISLVIQIPLGLVGAYLIYRTKRFYRLYRFCVFIPVVLSASAIALLFTLIFNAEFGPVNTVLRSIGLDSWTRSWLSDASVVYFVVMTPMTYQYIGLYVIIELSGMQAIPDDVIESATIDGASSFRIFWNIVVPMQRAITGMCAILIISGCFKAFEHSYIMTWGGPGYASSFLGVYMYTETFVKGNYGKGSAVSMVILVGTLICTLIFQALNRRKED